MKKINIILDETTIINFPFFARLIKRYFVLAIIIPLLSVGAGIYLYQKQKVIFEQSVSFTYAFNDSDSPTSAIASLLGEKTNKISPSQILGIASNIDFLQGVSIRLQKHPDLLKMVFTNPGGKKEIKAKELLFSCRGVTDCEVKRLKDRVSSLSSIYGDSRVDEKYWVKVKSHDAFTTKELLKILASQIKQTRINGTKGKIQEQLSVSEELVQNKKAELEEANYKGLLNRQERIRDGLKQIEIKFSTHYQTEEERKLKLAYVETRLAQTKNTLVQGYSEEEKGIIDKRDELVSEKKKIRKDILAIKATGDTDDNAIILRQLKRDESVLEKRIRKMSKRVRAISSTVAFVDGKEGESNVTEFDYKVLKGQNQKLAEDFKEAKNKRNKLIKELAIIDNTLDKLRPSLESLKLIENKITQLRILESTVVSDLIFSKESTALGKFKKSSRGRAIALSLAIAFITLFIVMIVLYLFDDRIFDEFELERSFEDLSVIGNTPDFD